MKKCDACNVTMEEDESRECPDCECVFHSENGQGGAHRVLSCFRQHSVDSKGCGYEPDDDEFL